MKSTETTLPAFAVVRRLHLGLQTEGFDEREVNTAMCLLSGVLLQTQLKVLAVVGKGAYMFGKFHARMIVCLSSPERSTLTLVVVHL